MLSHDEQAASLDSIDRVRQRVVDHLSSNRGGAVDFIANLHRAVDKVVQQAGEPGTNCRIGCAHCCIIRVEVTEPEIFRIAREVRKWPAAQVAALLERLRNLAADTTRLRRTDCAFLENRLCSIYEVRPAVCRRAHSLAAEKCGSFAPEIPQSLEKLLQADVLMKGTAEAYRQVGLHASAHELGNAVLLVLSDETAETRWYNGEAVFPEDRAWIYPTPWQPCPAESAGRKPG